MKKIISSVFMVLLILSMTISFTACKPNKKSVSSDAKTLNLRVYKSGYGDDYIKALASSFTTNYAKEGYKVNIVTSDSTIEGSIVTTEMTLGANNGIDIYVTGNVSPSTLVNISVAEGIDMMAADLTDVYNSKAIKADKTEESITILEKLKSGYSDYMKYNGNEESYKGKFYGFAYRSSPCGIIVNQKLLESYGLTIPKTTDELISSFDTISQKTSSTKVYPTAWAGLNASTYWYMVEDVWVAQYSGIQKYRDFLDMTYSKDIKDSYKVYEDKGWESSLGVLEKLLNLNYAPDKTISMDHSTAQHKFLSGEAVYMVNGAWLQNEMAANYLAQVKDMTMISTPVISDLGVKLALDGNKGSDAAKCDKILSKMVGFIDEGRKTLDIISAVSSEFKVTLSESQVNEVFAARNIFYDWGCTDSVVVNASSKKLEIAKLFLRYMASDDGIGYFYNYASALTPYKAIKEIDFKSSDSKFLKSVFAMAEKKDAKYINRIPGGYRNEFNVNWFSKYPDVEKMLAASKGTLSATDVMKSELKYAKDNWAKILKEAGIK